ncbi:phospholipase C [Candidatus Methylacidiphilum infernorum]|uniref:Phospholipase C n=1 Tax=Methylacidiphilum infernorum (isolate V4) TaxID=481448 RepID=B3DX40_METI4|nr:alkaline phosphatase family protein [Candidatus Methylacidiphilum infernorum]ACD82180.1 Phospholipase C [Methylacidiphilum infernorum V4]
MKKKLRIESLEKRYLMHAAPVDHQSHLSAMQGGVALDGVESAGSRNIIVKDWSQFKAADFADKIYNDVTIDNKTGWFNGKSGAFLGFNKLEVEGNLKGSTLEILGLNPTVNNAVQVDGNMVNSSVISPAAQVEKIEVKGRMELAEGSMVLTNALGSLEVGGKLLVDGGIIETTSKDLGKVEATKGITLQGGLIGSTSGIGEIESMGKITESKGSSIFAWSGIGAIKGKELDLDGVVYAYKGITLEGKDGVVIGKEGLIESKRGVVSVKSDDEILNKGVVEGVGVMMDSKGDDPYSLAVENEGTIRALGEGSGEGKVILKAEQNAVQDEGKLIARDGDTGGEVEINAPWAVLWGKGTVDVRGKDGGGKVILQGTNAVVGPQDVIEASAVDKGNGGQIRILADNTTVVGNLLANGGKDGGSGGRILLEGLNQADFGGKILASAQSKGEGGMVSIVSVGPVVVDGKIELHGGEEKGDGGMLNILAGNDLTTGGRWNLDAGQRGNGGMVALVSQGENEFRAELTALGGKESGNGGTLFYSSGWIGTDFNGIADMSARANGNGGLVILESTGESAITGSILVDGGKNGGNGGQIFIQGDKTVYNVGTYGLSAPQGTVGMLNFEAPKVSADLFSNAPGQSPIRHVIMVMGENHSFDNFYATYVPKQGQSVKNFLSEGIINPNGTPGPHFSTAEQATAVDRTIYQIEPKITGFYKYLPQPYSSNYTTPDKRFPTNLPNGPFQITKWAPYDSKTGDPIHTYFTELQQTDGGTNRLYTWVGQTFSKIPEGGVSMGFYNVLAGNGKYFNYLANAYALGDNFHQSLWGATAPNTLNWVTGGVPLYYTADGKAAVPPQNQIQNPNPVLGTNNRYINDGAAYINFSDPSQPGVEAVRKYLSHLPYSLYQNGDAQKGYYYMLTDYDPAYNMNGSLRPLGPNIKNVPPSNDPTIFQDLQDHGVSWAWFAQGKNTDPQAISIHREAPLYFQYIMESPLKNNIQGMTQFYQDVANDSLPAVSFVRPDATNDGHPASSTPAALQHFFENLVNHVQANKKLWYSSAIMFTVDSTGGYYQPGYNQALTYFGDGPKIPFLMISPYVGEGVVNHQYADTVSMDKFVEKNWKLPPIASNTLDNLPNPVTNPSDPYIPENRPAIGDLTNYFNYSMMTPTDKGNIPSAGQFPVGEQKELNGKGGSSPAIQMVPRSQTGGLDLANEDSLGVFRV